MRQRLLYYASGIALFLLLIALLILPGSVSLGEFGPRNTPELYLFWGMSTFIFILTVTVAFMLFRTVAKLFIERSRDREGSRIRTKLVVGALLLSFIPLFFMVLWNVSILTYNLDKWFSRPAQNIKLTLIDVGTSIVRDAAERANAQANWLALVDREEGEAGLYQKICNENGIVLAKRDGVTLCSVAPNSSQGLRKILATVSAWDGSKIEVETRMPVDLELKEKLIERSVKEYDQLNLNKKETRAQYQSILALITLFIAFVATWIALFLARQITEPISALLKAAHEVRQGNLAYRVERGAIDELGKLVRAFNEMTADLEGSSRELELRRRFTEAILESIPTGVISVARDGRILKVNRAFQQMFQGPQAEAAQRLEDLFTREDAAEIRYLMKRARRTGLATQQMDMQKAGQTIHLSITVSALEDNVSSGFVVVVEDTSELLRAQKASAWHEVARRIAHEIKNPLTPIALCAERIQRHLERAVTTPEFARVVRECTLTIASEVESVKTLVDEFSQFARFPSPLPTPSDLNEVVENALNVFAGRLDGITVHKNLSTDLPQVNIDREQFKRIVVNLVDNAAEAMQDLAVKDLTITTQMATNESVELIVADTGSGVSPEDREKLFLPYFSTKSRGTGLGLAIVSHIVTDHHAQIRVEDNLPRGTRFVLEIPALISAEQEAREIEVKV